MCTEAPKSLHNAIFHSSPRKTTEDGPIKHLIKGLLQVQARGPDFLAPFIRLFNNQTNEMYLIAAAVVWSEARLLHILQRIQEWLDTRKKDTTKQISKDRDNSDRPIAAKRRHPF